MFEHTLLLWDTLRQRADNMLEHERAGLPLLDFKYEILLGAGRFDPPANYALLRIPEVGDLCWEDCVDARRRGCEPRCPYIPSLRRLSLSICSMKLS